MHQLELEFDDLDDEIEDIPFMGDNIRLQDLSCTTLDKCDGGWEHYLHELFRYEIIFAIVPAYERDQVELWFDSDRTVEVDHILGSFDYQAVSNG